MWSNMCPTATTPRLVPDSFWRHLATAPAALLLLDYDGTLAPFRVERQLAKPYPGVQQRLQQLLESSRTRLAIISGRPAAEVVRLLAIVPTPEIWGMHGFERRRQDGQLEREVLAPASQELLAEATRLGEAILTPERLERKPAAIAFHWRGLRADQAEAARRELEAGLTDRLASSPLEMHRFDGGLEVRPRDVDKGRAIEQLIAEEDDDAAVAYLGDDLTDEDAFRALDGRGLPVLVKSRPRPTAARVRLKPPGELLRFLDRWLEIRERGAHA